MDNVETIDPAKFEYKQVRVVITPPMNFDDIRQVQTYLRVKMIAKRAARAMLENTYSKATIGGHQWLK